MRPALSLTAVAFLLAACGLVPETPVGLECQRLPAEGGEMREGEDPLAAGGPLAGLPVTEMAAADLGARAEELGFGVTYRYHYEVGAQPESGSQGYSECWCIPPPPGRVTGVSYDAIGRIIVIVDSGDARDSVRPQPVEGWGCEEEPVSS